MTERTFEQHVRALRNSSGMEQLTVYYGRQKKTGHIKIGSSRDPARRACSLSCELVATEDGGRRREGERLWQFSHARLPSSLEWFDGTDVALRHWISLLGKPTLPVVSDRPWQPSALYKLTALELKRDPVEFARERSAPGTSWNRIARDLWEATAGAIDISGATLKNWTDSHEALA